MNDLQYSDNNIQDDNSQSMPMIAQPSEDAQVQTATNFQAQISSLPQEANDVDLIEKEWVTHLKHIVSQTSQDPYTQQSEISFAKADYMRKRYNKDIKITEA